MLHAQIGAGLEAKYAKLRRSYLLLPFDSAKKRVCKNVIVPATNYILPASP